jgi:hypothetical protein
LPGYELPPNDSALPLPDANAIPNTANASGTITAMLLPPALKPGPEPGV